MCIGASEARLSEEEIFYSVLRSNCQRKVDSKLKPGETLFDYESDEYGFCDRCSREIRKLGSAEDLWDAFVRSRKGSKNNTTDS